MTSDGDRVIEAAASANATIRQGFAELRSGIEAALEHDAPEPLQAALRTIDENIERVETSLTSAIAGLTVRLTRGLAREP